MRYLLDSDSLSDLYEPSAPGHPRIAGRVASLAGSDRIFISILALCEFEYGYAKAPGDKKAAILQWISDMQADFEMLPLTPEAARLFGNLKAMLVDVRKLSKKAAKTHNVDVMLAAIALSGNCTLVSADSLYSDLRKIAPTLRVENWLA
jgi:predicted nucleic acid-binding protein